MAYDFKKEFKELYRPSGKPSVVTVPPMSYVAVRGKGNPNAEGLPEWEPYTAEKGATMIFNNDCQVKYNHDKELLEVVMAFPTRGF